MGGKTYGPVYINREVIDIILSETDKYNRWRCGFCPPKPNVPSLINRSVIISSKVPKVELSISDAV